MQCRAVQDPMERSMHLKCKLSKWLPRMYNIPPVVASKMPNATIAAGMDTFSGNVHLHHVPVNKVESRIVVDGILEDAEVHTEEDEEVVVEDHSSQLESL